jgi:hypothetical protein
MGPSGDGARADVLYAVLMGTRTPDAPRPGSVAPKRKREAPREMSCRVKVGKGPERRGHAILTDDSLRFNTGRTGKGGEDFFIHLAFDEILKIDHDVTAETLTFATEEHPRVVFFLGRNAAPWKKLIEERPHSLAVLYVKPKSRIAVTGVGDEAFLEELEEAVPGCTTVDPESGENFHLIFLGFESKHDLGRIAGLVPRLKTPGGIIWVVYPDKTRGIDPDEIPPAAKAAGLLSGDVVVVSKTHHALRLTRR